MKKISIKAIVASIILIIMLGGSAATFAATYNNGSLKTTQTVTTNRSRAGRTPVTSNTGQISSAKANSAQYAEDQQIQNEINKGIENFTNKLYETNKPSKSQSFQEFRKGAMSESAYIGMYEEVLGRELTSEETQVVLNERETIINDTANQLDNVHKSFIDKGLERIGGDWFDEYRASGADMQQYANAWFNGQIDRATESLLDKAFQPLYNEINKAVDIPILGNAISNFAGSLLKHGTGWANKISGSIQDLLHTNINSQAQTAMSKVSSEFNWEFEAGWSVLNAINQEAANFANQAVNKFAQAAQEKLGGVAGQKASKYISQFTSQAISAALDPIFENLKDWWNGQTAHLTKEQRDQGYFATKKGIIATLTLDESYQDGYKFNLVDKNDNPIKDSSGKDISFTASEWLISYDLDPKIRDAFTTEQQSILDRKDYSTEPGLLEKQVEIMTSKDKNGKFAFSKQVDEKVIDQTQKKEAYKFWKNTGVYFGNAVADVASQWARDSFNKWWSSIDKKIDKIAANGNKLVGAVLKAVSKQAKNIIGKGLASFVSNNIKEIFGIRNKNIINGQAVEGTGLKFEKFDWGLLGIDILGQFLGDPNLGNLLAMGYNFGKSIVDAVKAFKIAKDAAFAKRCCRCNNEWCNRC